MKRTAIETLLEIRKNLCYFLVSVLSIIRVFRRKFTHVASQ